MKSSSIADGKPRRCSVVYKFQRFHGQVGGSYRLVCLYREALRFLFPTFHFDTCTNRWVLHE